MRVTEINLSDTEKLLGLKPLKLHGLDRQVLLAGRNGAGKSRVLQILKELLDQAPRPSELEQHRDSLSKDRQSLKKVKSDHEQSIHALTDPHLPEQNRKNIELARDRYRSNIESLKNSIRHAEHRLSWDAIKTSSPLPEQDAAMTNSVYVDAVPKNLILGDDRSFNLTQWKQHEEQAQKLGHTNANICLSYIRRVLEKDYDSTHPASSVSEVIKATHIRRAEELRSLIKEFLVTDVERDSEGTPCLFGKPIFETNLSDGQKILLQICVQIHAQKASLDKLIILMDEPENHLHPEAAIDMIVKINEAVPNGQIWVGTHSLPILSYFHGANSTLLFVEDGLVEFAGSTPERVLLDLVGGDERVQKLRDFTALPGVYAMNQYAAECLLPPAVVGAAEHDPQTEQIHEHLQVMRKEIGDDALKVIDFGAGKGRLLKSLQALSENLKTTTDYYAYDEFPDDKDVCVATLSSVYGSGEERYFSKLTDVTSKFGKHKFDIVVMCNVLHEIEPKDWLGLFGDTGKITTLLKENGVLLLVEDEEIPIGEKAHAKGFIVFDTTELRSLFDVKDEPFVFSDKRNDGRLKAHIIPRSWMSRVTAETRIQSLKDRISSSMQEIRSIRQATPSHRIGRKHGFWVQQLANATLALSELEPVD